MVQSTVAMRGALSHLPAATAIAHFHVVRFILGGALQDGTSDGRQKRGALTAVLFSLGSVTARVLLVL